MTRSRKSHAVKSNTEQLVGIECLLSIALGYVSVVTLNSQNLELSTTH